MANGELTSGITENALENAVRACKILLKRYPARKYKPTDIPPAINSPPCDTCQLSATCKTECKIFKQYVNSGKQP